MDQQTVARLKRVLKSAKRLHEDAELLRENGRLSSAYALSLLSIEEIGKALIELWSENAYWDDPSPIPVKSGRLTFHIRKQIAFASLIFAGEVIDAKGDVEEDERCTDEFRALYQEVFDREEGSAILIDAMFGILNKGKERAFYADSEDNMSEFLDVPEAEVNRLLNRHGEAIGRLSNYRVMAFARPTYQHALEVIANAYREMEAALKSGAE